MINLKKEVFILAITHGDNLTLERHEHEGYEILQLPGSRSLDELHKIAQRIIGAEHAKQIQNFGQAINIIIKPNETVEIVTNIYKVEIDDTSKLKLPESFAWYSKEELASDPRGRRDAKFHLRLIEKKPLDVKFSEEQLGKWIDAKILDWKE